MPTIARAITAADFERALDLMGEYVAWDGAQLRALGYDADAFLAFHYGDKRRGDESLPGEFAPPGGCLLLATEGMEAVGCVAFRRLSADTCEMKRLYVRQRFQGQGVGRELVESLIATARDAGYSRMVLDTMVQMKSAVALYTALGFRRCDPYHEIPPGFEEITLFLELEL